MPTLPKAISGKHFTNWSYSRYAEWHECAYRAKLKNLDKLGQTDKKSDAMQRGSDIHEAAQVYAVMPSASPKMPKVLENFKQEFKWLRKNQKQLIVEQQYALDSEWKQTDWFDNDAQAHRKKLPWLRLVVDAALQIGSKLHLIDHKSGKVRESNNAQLELYAIAGYSIFDNVKEVSAELWYLDQGVQTIKKYLPADIPKLKKKWEMKVLPMLKDRSFKKQPGRYCTWCPYRKSAGGPCTY